jgi:hypothetical protein
MSFVCNMKTPRLPAYQYLGSSEEERQKNLVLFKEWIGNWNLKKWPDVVKEEMDGLKVRY